MHVFKKHHEFGTSDGTPCWISWVTNKKKKSIPSLSVLLFIQSQTELKLCQILIAKYHFSKYVWPKWKIQVPKYCKEASLYVSVTQMEAGHAKTQQEILFTKIPRKIVWHQKYLEMSLTFLKNNLWEGHPSIVLITPFYPWWFNDLGHINRELMNQSSLLST